MLQHKFGEKKKFWLLYSDLSFIKQCANRAYRLPYVIYLQLPHHKKITFELQRSEELKQNTHRLLLWNDSGEAVKSQSIF